MLLNWKGGAPRCRFCKRSNHLVKDCRNLKRKLEKEHIDKMDQLAKDSKTQLEQSNMDIDDNISIQNDNDTIIINKNDLKDKSQLIINPNNENKINEISNNHGKETSTVKNLIKNSRLGPINLKKHLEQSKINKASTSLSGLSKQQKAAIKKNNEKVDNISDDPFAGDNITNE